MISIRVCSRRHVSLIRRRYGDGLSRRSRKLKLDVVVLRRLNNLQPTLKFTIDFTRAHTKQKLQNDSVFVPNS